MIGLCQSCFSSGVELILVGNEVICKACEVSK